MGGPSAGAGRAFRLDPHCLEPRAAATAGDAQDFRIDLKEAAVIKRIGSAGPALTVPFAEYRGVAVRIDGGHKAGDVRATLELLHADPALTIALAMVDDVDRVEADWREWGRALDLPLLIIAPDGTVGVALARPGALLMLSPKMRRRPAHFTRRRPRFLVRRKTGRSSDLERTSGREIIARN
jgi:hypothetical protein